MIEISELYGAPYSTGELRAALQPVVFVRLTVDVGLDFPAGTIAAAQYWGQGKVKLTRFPDGVTMAPVAHQVEGEFLHTPEPPIWPNVEHPLEEMDRN